jgi:hypothetical protein
MSNKKQFKHNLEKTKRQRKSNSTKLLSVMFTNMGNAYIKDEQYNLNK